MNVFHSPLVYKLVDLAIEEDLSFGDLTSELVTNDHSTSNQSAAALIAREDLVVCGLDLTQVIVTRAGYDIRVKNQVKDGDKVKAEVVLQKLWGPLYQLTALERIILNFLQRLSGVATYTRSIVEQVSGITVLDTRKTMPGFRVLDKYATAIGGAKNHRMHLGEMILIKNNHIDATPGTNVSEKIHTLLSKIQNRKRYYLPYQIEIRTEEELRAALAFSPAAVLLDNMDDALISRCVASVKKQSPATQCEASGGIDINRLKTLATLGVDAASLGRLTTRAPNVDISMRIVFE